MTDSSKRLIRAGFLSDAGKEKFAGKSIKEIEKIFKAEKISDDDAENYANHHVMELWQNQMIKTPYPVPVRSYHIIYETFSRPLESVYMWCINQFEDMGFPIVDKITDVFSASEQSSFFGISQQRLGLQQDKVAQYLGAIGKLVKDLFQIVREVRIIDERLQYYDATSSDNKDVRDPAEIALKGLFVDLVEGGAKSPASVYGLSRELQFVTLPDLFFSIHPRNKEEVKPMVEKLEFNRKVKEVLERKLFQYLMWRDSTYGELKTRRTHTIKYLRQHYDAIQLYMTWIKPYLKQIARLSIDQKKTNSADLIAAFEGSVIEVELLARRIPEGNNKVYTCIVLNMTYRTSPEIHPAEEYQRRVIHRGKIDIQWRTYGWTEKQINAFKEMRNEESFAMLSTISESIQAAMDELGDDLRKYLIEAGEKFPGVDTEEEKKKPAKPELPGIFDPFLAPFKGASEIFGSLFAESPAKQAAKAEADLGDEIKTAQDGARVLGWNHYKLFKKAHKMITW